MNANKYTQKSLEAIQEAQAVATEYGNQQIEQAHLLLALLETENGLIPQLLTKMGLTVPSFAAAVKIDAFAYTPAQDFGNAFSTFIAQNYGAGRHARIRAGVKGAVLVSFAFCAAVSAVVWVLAEPLMMLFVSAQETAILAEGVRYLHIAVSYTHLTLPTICSV